MPSVISCLCPPTLSLSIVVLFLFRSSLPSLLFFLAHSCSLFPSRVIHSYSSSPHIHIVSFTLSLLSIVPSPSPLSRLLFVLFFSYVFSCIGLRLSHVKLPSSSFIFLSFHSSPLSLSLSFCFVSSHTSHSSFRVSSSISLMFSTSSLSRSPFFPVVAIPSSSPFSSTHFPLYPSVSLAFCRRTPLSSRSIELRSSGSFYLAQSSYFLRLFFFFFALSFLSSPLFLSFFSSSLARSRGILSEHDASCS